MDRAEVYRKLEGEFSYQQKKLKTMGWDKDENKHIGDFITYMRVYLNKVENRLTTEAGDVGALDELRKVVALGVRCLEVHGCPDRI